ncbi:hypothetical protein EsH8_I_001470 [Colletotrichum jinshuiense]
MDFATHGSCHTWSSEHSETGYADGRNGNSSSDGSRKLVFRVELEFLIQIAGGTSSGTSSPGSNSAHTLGGGFGNVGNDRTSDVLRFIAGRLHDLGLRGVCYDDPFYGDDGVWGIDVDQNVVELPEKKIPKYKSYTRKWRSVRVKTPLWSFTKENMSKLEAVCDKLKTTQGLVIGMNHVPRLRVEVKPQTGDYTLHDLRRIVAFLWEASPRINQLHAEYCGPGSMTAPGLEFSRLFSPFPHVFLSDTEWRCEPAETVFTHGPPVPTRTGMLKPPDVGHESAVSRLAVLCVSLAQDLEWLVDETRVHAKDWEGNVRVLPGAYDFSKILDKDPRARTIQFAQHAGTLDFGAVENWIKVCHGLVFFCLNATEDKVEHVRELLRLPIPSDPALKSPPFPYSIFDLLDDLDLSSQSRYYQPLGTNPFVPELDNHRRRKPAINLNDTKDLSPYTFGIELEFLLPYANEGTDDPYPSDPRWFYRHNPQSSSNNGANQKYYSEFQHLLRDLLSDDEPESGSDASSRAYSGNADHLAKIINSAGHCSATLHDLFDKMSTENLGIPNSALLAIAESNGHHLHLVEDVDPRYQTWCVKQDCSLSRSSGGLLGYSGGHVGVEVSSPILRNHPTDFGSVVDVLRIVRGGMRPMLDLSCGLHVHVGSVCGFSLRALRRIATLIWAVDPILYTLVHPSRKTSLYTLPLRTSSILATDKTLPEYNACLDLRRVGKSGLRRGDVALSLEIEAHVPMDRLPERLQREFFGIWAAESHWALWSLLAPRRGMKGGVSFMSVRGNLSTEHSDAVCEGTIEFRLLEGTLDPELITDWTKLLLKIVETAETTRPVEFFRVVSRLLETYRNEDDRLAGFLDAFGLGGHLPFWAKVAERNRALAADGSCEGAENPTRWQPPVFGGEQVSEDTRTTLMRTWFEENIVRLLEIDEDMLDRVKGVL